LLKLNPNYRANPARAIFVQGRIEQQLIERLTPQIIKLQGQSREPITVYINSPGGSTSHADALTKLLLASDQDYSPSCRLVTVVTGRAASAAADLLCAGSYALAYPDSIVFFHGVRNLADGPITETDASEMMESMRHSNERYALALADKSLSRFGFRYISQRAKFAEYRTRIQKPDRTDLLCFVGIIREHLSRDAIAAVDRALDRNQRYVHITQYVGQRVAKKRRVNAPQRAAEPEAEIIKAIVDYELLKNKKNPSWSFSAGGLRQLTLDFLLVREYLNIYDSAHLKQFCDLFGDYLLTPAELHEFSAIENEAERAFSRNEKIKSILRPLWLFFIALCYALQETDNELTAADAFWLGLIDEVVGRQDLSPERLTLEAAPDGQIELALGTGGMVPTEPIPTQ